MFFFTTFFDKVCNSGKCVQNTISPGVTSAAHWSEWSTSECKSGCIVRSKGFKEKTRTCIKQTPVTIGSTCPGQSRDSVVGCSPGCKQGETKTAQSYAKTMCTKFLEIEPALKRKINAYGEQTKHSMDRPELACQVKNLFRIFEKPFPGASSLSLLFRYIARRREAANCTPLWLNCKRGPTLA